MRSSKGTSNNNHNNNEEDEDYEEEEEDFTSSSSKKGGGASSSAHKAGKGNDKVNAMRSKHSVTEQRRRSKINERFQILRDLIPHGDQKRDTASFLVEVIEYVQLLQEKVQKYEGSYQGWSPEPTKLMPWRHSHWRVQSLLGHPQPLKNPVMGFPGKYDEKGVGAYPGVNGPGPSVDGDINRDAFTAQDQHSELGDNSVANAAPLETQIAMSVQSDGDGSHLPQRPASEVPSSPCLMNSSDQPGEHVIEGGTVSISGAYSHGLLMTLTQALQSSGVDLSQASISIQIDLGNRANQSLISAKSSAKEQEQPVSNDIKIGHARNEYNGDGSDHPQKKLKS